jgi:valyl-tRNA synthetase
MPFISEEIWQHLPHRGETITLATWPQFEERYVATDAVREMNLLMEVIRAVRNIRAEMNVPMSRKIEMMLKPNGEAILTILRDNETFLRRFCNTESLTMDLHLGSPDKAVTAVISGAELFLPLAGLIDIGQEVARLEKELQTLRGEIERIVKKMANPGFVAKAPAKVIEEEIAKQADYQDKYNKVQTRLEELRR